MKYFCFIIRKNKFFKYLDKRAIRKNSIRKLRPVRTYHPHRGAYSRLHRRWLSPCFFRFPVTAEMVEPSLDGKSLADALKDKEIYIIDLKVLDGIICKDNRTVSNQYNKYFTYLVFKDFWDVNTCVQKTISIFTRINI